MLLVQVEQKRGADLATARHIVYICNSRIYDMPVMACVFVVQYEDHD